MPRADEVPSLSCRGTAKSPQRWATGPDWGFRGVTQIFIDENDALTSVSASQGIFLSRLTESNRRPTHYECVALAD